MTITIRTNEASGDPVTQNKDGTLAAQDLAALRQAVQGFNAAITAIPGGDKYSIAGTEPNGTQKQLGVDHLKHALAKSYAGKENWHLVVGNGHSAAVATECTLVPAYSAQVQALTQAVQQATTAAQRQEAQLTTGNSQSNKARLEAVESDLLNDLKKLPNAKAGVCGMFGVAERKR